MVNMPGCVGSPSRMAILAPLGKAGGPSFHSTSVAGKSAIGLLAWPAAAVEIVNRSRLRAQRGLIGVGSPRAGPTHLDPRLGLEDAPEPDEETQLPVPDGARGPGGEGVAKLRPGRV